jgi:hypothetical protein
MVWHIFKKDWKLLWRMAIGVALINLIQRAMVSSAGPFWDNQRSPLAPLYGMLENISVLATGFLVVMVVQQDAIPSLCQDWLVRPIRRRDLLLSKMLFVALAVQGPIFLMEMGQGLAAGFPLGQALGAPLSRSLWMLLAFDLPVLAFATLTRNLAQAAGAGIAVFLGYAFFVTITQGYLLQRVWVHDLAQVLWGLLAVAVVLALQYYRRKTTRARWIYGAAALVWMTVLLVPWQTAFAVQQRLSPQPAAADPVQIAFDPGSGKFHTPAGAGAPVRFLRSGPMNDVDVWVPLRTGGVSESQMVMTDLATARITGPGGIRFDLGPAGGSVSWRVPGAEQKPRYQLIYVPREVYNQVKDQPLSLEIDFSLTLLRADAPQTMPAVGGDQWIEGLGRCATRNDAAGMGIDVGCLAPGNPPFNTWSLKSPTGPLSIESLRGQPDFAPCFGRVNGDSISRFAFQLPAAGSQLKDQQAVVRVYRPEAHFTRRVMIPDIWLSDWRAE